MINKPLIKVSEFNVLKDEVSTEMLKLIEEYKDAYKISSNTDTVFSITHFFLSSV